MNALPPNDSDLIRLMDDAVSDVHPEGTVDQIRARAHRPSAGRWVPITLAAAAATAVVIGGAAWLAQSQPQSNPPAAGPAPSSQAPASQEPAGRTVQSTVYYVGATAGGRRLFPEVRRVTDATGSDLQVAVDEALRGSAHDPDYSTALPPGTTAEATSDGQQVTLDVALSGNVMALDGDVGQLAVQSLVWTADEAVGDLPVRFLVDGQPADQLFGVDISQPVQKTSADSVLAPVLVDSPADGARLPTTFTVKGRAATFEANVVWELKRGEETVRNGFTTAQECCTLSPYSFEVTAPPGDYTLVVHDTDESDGEGVGISQDTKEITVE